MPIDSVQFITPELARELCDLSGPRWEFVGRFGALASEGMTAQHFARYQYWNESFAYWKSIAQLECAWQGYEDASAKVRNMSTVAQRRDAARHTLLPLRVALVQLAKATVTHQLQLLSDPGDLGTPSPHFVPGSPHVILTELRTGPDFVPV